MIGKQNDFNAAYKEKCKQIKWFEPYIQTKILDEWNSQCIKTGMKLLDVGGGCSLDSIFYAINEIETTVLDYAENALNKLKQMSDFFGVSLSFLQASILDVPKEHFGRYDIITDNGCFHHIEPKDRILYINSVANLLKPEGILYIRAVSEYMPPSVDTRLRAYRISSDDIVTDAFLCKFKIIELSLFDYIYTAEGNNHKMWFIKMQRRK